MADWEDIRHFLAVGHAGTLSGAARHLKVDHATVSRRLASLEAALQVRLVERLPRSCRLTSIGAQIFERVAEMEAAYHGVARLAAGHASHGGRVTLSAPPVLVAHLLAQHLGRFTIEHPHIRLSVSAEGQQVSLSRREADVAVRLVRPQEKGVFARRVGQMDFGLYAHRAYTHLASPERWQFIAFDQAFDHMPQQSWLLGIAANRPIACELNHIGEHLIAARAGAGVAGLPCFVAGPEGSLVRIDEQAPSFSRDIWLVVHRELRKAPMVRAVMDFVASAISQDSYLCLHGEHPATH